MTFYNVFLLALLVFASSQAFASDPSQLQDFCVADNTSQVIVNGLVCKNPNVVTPEDFFFQGLDKAGNTANKLGSNVNRVNVDKIPGLNTLGVSIARIDIAPYGGLNTLHFHPRGSEIATVIEGTVYVGFVTSDPNKLFAKVLNKGDVYVFPQGTIHFEFNIGPVPAVVLSGFSSQNPGVVTIADAVFGSNPYISDDVLAKAFQLDKKTIDWLKSQFPISSAY